MLTMTKPEGAAQRETPDVWRQRIEGAIKYGKSFHRMAEDRRRAMLGPSYIDGMSGETVGQEPLWWRVYRNFIPAVGFADPGFSAKSKNPGGRDGFYGFVAMNFTSRLYATTATAESIDGSHCLKSTTGLISLQPLVNSGM